MDTAFDPDDDETNKDTEKRIRSFFSDDAAATS